MAGREFSTYWFFYQEQKRKIPGGWKRKSKKELGNVFNLNLIESPTHNIFHCRPILFDKLETITSRRN